MTGQGLSARILLFATILGTSLPLQLVGTQGKVALADTEVTDSSQVTDDITSAKTEINGLIDSLAPDMSISGTKTDLEQTYETNITKTAVLDSVCQSYQNGKLTRTQFLSRIKSMVSELTALSTPTDWQDNAALFKTLIEQRQADLDQSGVTNTQMTTSLQNYRTDESATTLANNSMNETITGFKYFWQNFTSMLLTTSVETATTDSTIHDDQRTFALFMVAKLAEMRKDQINTQKLGTDAQKQAASATVDQTLSTDQTQLKDSSLTKADMITLMQGFYSEFEAIIPTTSYNQASDDDKTTAIAALQAAYDSTLTKLNQVTGYAADVATAKTNLKETLASYTDKIKSASTVNAINDGQTAGVSALKVLATLKPTASELAAILTEINNAATAQKTMIDSDGQATEAQKATAKATIDAQVTKYTFNAKQKTTTLQVLTTIKNAAISTIQATKVLHPDSASTTTSTDAQATALTATQVNAAINAVITAGNTKKVAIQDDAKIDNSLKVAAYAAIDKLVSDYEAQLKAANSINALETLQADGVATVNTYTVATGKASTSKTSNQASIRKIVYAVNKVKLYQHPSLTGSVVATYAKQKRTQRPMFEVTKIVKNVAGKSVYEVKALANGKKGYLTRSSKSVVNAYYQSTPKQVRVIATNGINQYHSTKLNGKNVAVKKGTVLKVKKLIKSGLVTRFELSNGHYISANKKLVIATKY